jgi:hypothetical protein
MLYQDIELLDAKDRDMLIMSNLSDVQFMLRAGQEEEAMERIDAIKTMMIKTKELIAPASGNTLVSLSVLKSLEDSIPGNDEKRKENSNPDEGMWHNGFFGESNKV